MVKKTFTARVLVDGRITIPEQIRAVLSLEKGDLVEVAIEKLKSDTEVIMRGKGEE